MKDLLVHSLLNLRTGNMLDLYNSIMNQRDRRVDGWPLMDSVWPTLVIISLYYYIVRVKGPDFMKNRKAYNLKSVLLVYNLFQSFYNAMLLYKITWLWRDHYNWLCQPIDLSTSYEAMSALDATWWYFMAKFMDMLDSIFFLLHKKFSHLSTLHVVHHGIMPLSVWIGLRFFPGGHGTFCGFANSFIHVIMYLYYFLAALGPQVQPYLWWKKYLTQLQMLQFVLVFIHGMLPLFTDCDYPRICSWLLIGHGALFFVLFSNFYVQAYVKRKMAD